MIFQTKDIEVKEWGRNNELSNFLRKSIMIFMNMYKYQENGRCQQVV